MATDTLPPPVFEMRIDPPTAVSEALTAFEKTCAAWKPIGIGRSTPQLGITQEARWCDQITSRTDLEHTAFNVGMTTGVFAALGGVLAYFLLLRIWRALHATWIARFAAH